MIPNCKGCEYEYYEGIEYLNKGYDVCFEGLGERRHLFIVVFNKKGKMIVS